MGPGTRTGRWPFTTDLLPHPGSNPRWSRTELSYSYVNESRGQVPSYRSPEGHFVGNSEKQGMTRLKAKDGKIKCVALAL